MHELSICRAITGTVADHVGDRPVTSVRLQIGHFRQIVPTTLEYCWGLHTRGTKLEGCTLDIDYIPAVAHCDGCGSDTTLELPVVRCEYCDAGGPARLVSGEEFLVESIEVADSPLAEGAT